MVVQMITRQVCEYSTCKVQSSDSLLCHAMAAYLHECVFAFFVCHLSQKAVQCDGVGSSALCGDGFAVDIVTYGAAQSAFMSHAHKHII